MTDANDVARKSGAAALRKVIDKNAMTRPPAYSDEALALRFADQRTGERRYVAAFGKWLLYDGVRWRTDETLETTDLVRQICREAAAE
jgi:putative DNA primase/helicase